MQHSMPHPPHKTHTHPTYVRTGAIILAATLAGVLIYRLVALHVATNVTTNAANSAAPVVGILSIPVSMTDCSPAPNGQATGCINVHYVNWLTQSGARVVPIPWDASERDLDFFLNSVNAILFTGACFDISLEMPYMRAASQVYDRAVQMNNAGDVFPLWGNCMGMELLTVLAAAKNTSVLCRKCFDAENVSLPLNFTSESYSSALFRNAPEQLLTSLAKDWITLNIHHDGVCPSQFTKNPLLRKEFKVLSTSRDRKGKTFASAIEGNRFPFWGLQWHPERPQLQSPAFSSNPTTTMQYFASFIVKQAQRNRHKFASQSVEEKYLATAYRTHASSKGQSYYYTTPDAKVV